MLQEITTTGIVKENLVRKIPQKMEPFNRKAFTGKNLQAQVSANEQTEICPSSSVKAIL